MFAAAQGGSEVGDLTGGRQVRKHIEQLTRQWFSANGETGEHFGTDNDGDDAFAAVPGHGGGGGFDAVEVVDEDDRIE